jgi:hypothetical protein
MDGTTKHFPIGFSNPPPLGAKAPSGEGALRELRHAGGTFIRVGIQNWSPTKVEQQFVDVSKRFDEAADQGMHCWLWLGQMPANLPPRPENAAPSVREKLLAKIVDKYKGHPALGAYKGYDEPLHHTPEPIEAKRLIFTHKRLKAFDPQHPLVLIQAPVHKLAPLKKYVGAFDVTGADIFPLANPPADHAATGKKHNDLGLVGDVTRKMVAAAGGSPVWMTLQIAWSATPFPHVPCFPTLREERFMVYQAIVAGARGLTFFGGHMTQVCTPEDAAAGWNWTFWGQVLRPIVEELSSDALRPALLAPSERPAVTAKSAERGKSAGIELATRRDSKHLYVIAVRRGGTANDIVFSGLPRRQNGRPMTKGEVLFEHIQWPLPKTHPKQHSQVLRPVKVANGRFKDSFLPHDVHVYRFPL